MTRPRTVHPDEELKRFWSHIYYEHQMLRMTARWLIRNLNTKPINEDEIYEFPIHMESFLIHARNLSEFFHRQSIYSADPARNRPPKDDTIIAEDYFVGVTAWNPSPKNQLPPDVISRINTRLAHLTYSRPSIGNRNDYDYSDIEKRLEAAFDEFLQSAPQKRLDLSNYNPFYLPIPFTEEPSGS